MRGKIGGCVIRFGHSWMVPKDAKKPIDLRKKGIQEMEVRTISDTAN